MKQSQETIPPAPHLLLPSPNRNEFSPGPWWQQCWPVLFWGEVGPSDVLFFFLLFASHSPALPRMLSSYPVLLPVFLRSVWWGSWRKKSVGGYKLPLSLWLSVAVYAHDNQPWPSLNILTEFPFPSFPDIPSSVERQFCSLEEFIFAKSSGWLVALRPQLSA